MAITAHTIWLDGKLVQAATATAPVMGHAIQRGSLVFDVGAFHLTPAGPALFRARDNVRRFLNSARLIGLEVEPDEATLVDAAVAVVAASGASEGLIRWSAFLQVDNPDLVPHDMRASVAVAVQRIQDPPREKPIAVATFDDARKAAPLALPAEVKAAAAYLGPMLARKRAIAAGADEVVLLDETGHIAEGPTANTFCVIDGELWTPPLGRILPGITRRTAIELARELGVVVREEPLTREAFRNSDEAFLSGTSLPIAPIGRIDERALPAPGPITAKLLATLRAAQRGTRPEWLVYVATT